MIIIYLTREGEWNRLWGLHLWRINYAENVNSCKILNSIFKRILEEKEILVITQQYV